MNIQTNSKFRGIINLKVLREDGTCREDLTFDNLITDSGLDLIGNYMRYSPGSLICGVAAVGTGTTTPAFSDTSLTTFLANSSSSSGSSYSYIAGPPAYRNFVQTYTFNTGVATGTIAEIVIGNFPTSGATQPRAFSHALIMSGGSPTTITVLSSESLQLTYELRQYIDTTDTPISFVISGTTYTGTLRQANIAASNNLDTVMVDTGAGITAYYGYAYNGSIGTISTAPSGTSSQTDTTGAVASYTPGNYYVSIVHTWSPAKGNLSGGISAMMFPTSRQGSYQFSLSPVIPKTSAQTLTITFTCSWARYP